MIELQEQINNIELSPKGIALEDKLEIIYELISPNLTPSQTICLRKDFDQFIDKGRLYVHNTFAGGIIFLREPEIIEKIKIEFYVEANEAIASVEYDSKKRNARNVKYKPNAGEIENCRWNMQGIFPSFSTYEKPIKILLMNIIGKNVKSICEYHKKNSWFMEFEKEFEIYLFLEGKLEMKYHVQIH